MASHLNLEDQLKKASEELAPKVPASVLARERESSSLSKAPETKEIAAEKSYERVTDGIRTLSVGENVILPLQNKALAKKEGYPIKSIIIRQGEPHLVFHIIDHDFILPVSYKWIGMKSNAKVEGPTEQRRASEKTPTKEPHHADRGSFSLGSLKPGQEFGFDDEDTRVALALSNLYRSNGVDVYTFLRANKGELIFWSKTGGAFPVKRDELKKALEEVGEPASGTETSTEAAPQQEESVPEKMHDAKKADPLESEKALARYDMVTEGDVVFKAGRMIEVGATKDTNGEMVPIKEFREFSDGIHVVFDWKGQEWTAPITALGFSKAAKGLRTVSEHAPVPKKPKTILTNQQKFDALPRADRSRDSIKKEEAPDLIFPVQEAPKTKSQEAIIAEIKQLMAEQMKIEEKLRNIPEEKTAEKMPPTITASPQIEIKQTKPEITELALYSTTLRAEISNAKKSRTQYIHGHLRLYLLMESGVSTPRIKALSRMLDSFTIRERIAERNLRLSDALREYEEMDEEGKRGYYENLMTEEGGIQNDIKVIDNDLDDTDSRKERGALQEERVKAAEKLEDVRRLIAMVQTELKTGPNRTQEEREKNWLQMLNK